MMSDYFKIAVKNLKLRPLRSWLTVLGIVIGVFLVVSLLSLSEGLKESVMKELKMIGGDLIFVMPGEDMISSFIGGMNFNDNDIRAIERASGVKTVVTMPWASEVIRYGGEAKTTFLMGVSLEKATDILKEDMGWNTAQGDFPRPGRREVLISHLIATSIFPNIKVNDEITIKGGRYTISGVLKSLGNQNYDSMIIMNIDDFQTVTGKKEEISTITVKIKEGFDPENVVENIKNGLEETRKRRRGEDSASFSVLSSETASDMVGNIMNILQIGIIAFASIAIVVGGIGIMNTMYTSVKERTREIGILKAIGAKKSHINLIFLFEAGIIGLLGGIGGITSGILLSKSAEIALHYFAQTNHLRAHISPFLILFGLTFSFLIGCISGFFPAKKAAELTPVDALRYE